MILEYPLVENILKANKDEFEEAQDINNDVVCVSGIVHLLLNYQSHQTDFFFKEIQTTMNILNVERFNNNRLCQR